MQNQQPKFGGLFGANNLASHVNSVSARVGGAPTPSPMLFAAKTNQNGKKGN